MRWAQVDSLPVQGDRLHGIRDVGIYQPLGASRGTQTVALPKGLEWG